MSISKNLNNIQPQNKIRFTLIPAVYLILKKNEKYLFGKRQNTGFMDGFYGLPSGHVDGGENLKKAMLREAKEEINLEIAEVDLNLVFVEHRFIEKGVERIDFYFECLDFDEKQIINNEPEKCSSLEWLSLDNLEIIPYVKEAIQSLIQGNNYLDQGFID